MSRRNSTLTVMDTFTFLPFWRPGRHRGKKAKVALTVAVEFQLSKEKAKFGINGKTIN